MTSVRITWVRGAKQAGPEQLIGVLELKSDGSSRAPFATVPAEIRSSLQMCRESGARSKNSSCWAKR